MNKLFLLRESKELHMTCQSWVCVVVVGEWKWRGWENWAKIDSKTKGWTSSPFHTTQGKIFPWEISLFMIVQCKIPIMSSLVMFCTCRQLLIFCRLLVSLTANNGGSDSSRTWTGRRAKNGHEYEAFWRVHEDTKRSWWQSLSLSLMKRSSWFKTSNTQAVLEWQGLELQFLDPVLHLATHSDMIVHIHPAKTQRLCSHQ